MTITADSTPDAWSSVDEAFDRALDCEGEARASYLASLPEELRVHVADLLAAAARPGPLDSGVHGVAAELLAATEDRLDPMVDGRLIGPYRLIGRLGAGGMGVVYLAERADGEFDHRVALEVVRWSSPSRGWSIVS